MAQESQKCLGCYPDVHLGQPLFALKDRGVDETMEMERHRQRSRASTRRRAPESA